MKSAPRHFLELKEVASGELRRIVDMGASFKRGEKLNGASRPLDGRALAMIFEKPSTRTRVSFEIAMKQLGGTVVVLTPNEMQIGRGETIADTARVLSRYVDAIMMRTTENQKLSELASHAEVPVINGLTDRSHPCQLMADIMTFEEHRGDISGKRIAWCGDGNNMSRSWIEAAARFEFEMRLACPSELAPPQDAIDWARNEGATIVSTTDPDEALDGVDCVVTDMGVDGRYRGRETPQSVIALQGRPPTDGPRRKGCDLHALPGAPGRRGDDRDPGRTAIRHLG